MPASVPSHYWERSSNSDLLGSQAHLRSPRKCHLIGVLSLTPLYLPPLEHDTDVIISEFYESKTFANFVYSVSHGGSHAWH